MSDESPTMSPLKRAFLALEQAQAKVAALQNAAREPIAIVGVGCRVPGGDDPDGFWEVLSTGRDVVGPVPKDRWDMDAYYDPDPTASGKIATRGGGFLLGSIDGFDPEHFGIAHREAQGMDPQQRLFLEVAWEALENAGQAPDRLEKSITGVYVGMCSSDYAYLELQAGDPGLLDAHYTSGIAHSILSGRLSYLLGLQGPSVTLDTACSSSLVAVHLACQALRSGDCRMALAGGVNLNLSPDLFVSLSHARMLAPDGRCKTFSAKADGYGRGEGCGIVVLKRLSDAQVDGDRILAVVRGTAVNQDGPSGGLTAPNGPAQEAVIREALSRAGIAPNDVSFLEAHGTGTELGDPLEVQALGEVFGARDPKTPLYLGSVKTNFGHLEAAAGIAGLIKVLLALLHRQIPAHLHHEQPSPHIPWADLPFKVPTTLTPWEPIGGRRIGAVSSFGFSGTNAHVVLEEAPALAPVAVEDRPAHLFALSARTPKALAELAKRYATALEGRTDADLADVCFTANTGRAHLTERAVITATTIAELRTRLGALAEGREEPGLRAARATRRDPPKVAFLFTGQGAQYTGMARGIYDVAPVFRAALDKCAAILAPHLPLPLLDVVFGTTAEAAAALDETAFTQPALFAVEYALAELWRSWGISPSVVMGHSVGEYVAACLAGVMSLEDALVLIAKRGQRMQSLPAGGGMAALMVREADVATAIASHPTVSIAAVNAPEQTVIAGPVTDVEAIAKTFADRGARTKALVVSHAFHSPLVDPILDAFEADAKAVAFSAPRMRLVSNVTGELADPARVTQPSYWREHVRRAVRFGDGLRTLAEMKPDVVIEIGPHATLLSFARTVFADAPVLQLASLRKGQPDWGQMLDAVGALYLDGAAIDFRGLEGGARRRIVDLPTYPFQRERLWFAAKKARPVARRTSSHRLLGDKLRSAASDTVYESVVSADDPPWVRQHRILGHVIMPGTAYLEALLAAAGTGAGVPCLENVAVNEAMILDDDGSSRRMQTVCAPAKGGVVRARIVSQPEDANDDAWVEHVAGDVRRVADPAPPPVALDELRRSCPRPVEVEDHYAGFEQRGLAFGERLRPVRAIGRGEGAEAFGEVALDDVSAAEAAGYRFHPLLLDGCIQLVDSALLATVKAGEERPVFLPVGMGRVVVWKASPARCFAHVVVQTVSAAARRADLRVFDDQGGVIAEVRDIQVQLVTREALARLGDKRLDDWFYEIAWRAAPARPPSDPKRGKCFIVFADADSGLAPLADKLRARGDRCILVRSGSNYAHEADAAAIVPGDADPYRRLLAEIRPDGVVHGWGTDALSAIFLAQAVTSASPPPRMWLVTRGSQAAGDGAQPRQATAWGVAKSVRLEHPETACVAIDLDAENPDLDALAAELDQSPAEAEVALRRSGRHVPRLVRARRASAAAPPKTPYRLEPATPGSLGSLTTVPAERRAPKDGEVEIAVEATGLNFRDILNVLGMYPGDPGPLGTECAGKVSAVGPGVTHVKPGDDVLAFASGSFASHAVTTGALVAKRPPGMSAEEGASIPIAYLTAHFCLVHVAGLKQGEKVLIHAAAGGVGMAAVRIAQHLGAEIFATAGAPWKKQLLRDMGVPHVLDSRSTSFEGEVLAKTGTKGGVDVVLNSLSGDILDATFRVTRAGGRFTEIGKRGIKTPEWVAGLGRDLRYTIVDLGDEYFQAPVRLGGMLTKIMEDLRTGALQPPPVHVFSLADASSAFRFMAQARHAGKVVVRHGARASESAFARRDGTYLVTGGLAGIGPVVARWLAERGAGRLVLVSRRGLGPDAEALLADIRARTPGVDIVTAAADVSDEASLTALLARIREGGPPLRGVFHCAGVLADAALLRQDAAGLARVFAPKVVGATLLDRLTRSDPLESFVLFSSIAAVFGSRGQANYSAANAFLDALARDRRAQGLPALAIDWGAWAEVGMASGEAMRERMAAHGLVALTPAQGIRALERAMTEERAQVAIAAIEWGRFMPTLGSPTPALVAEIASDPGVTRGPATAKTEPAEKVDLEKALAAAPKGRWRPMVTAFVRERALRTLGVDPSRAVDPKTPLGELGLDSLLAVELRNALGAALNRSLPASLLFDYPTIEALSEHVLTTVVGADDGGPAKPAEPAKGSALVGSIEDLSDEEVERQLAARAGRRASS